METTMGRIGGKNDKIIGSIVVRNFVYMMNHLILFQFSIENRFNNISVINGSSNLKITVSSFPGKFWSFFIIFIPTFKAAKYTFSSFYSRWLNKKTLSTFFTNMSYFSPLKYASTPMTTYFSASSFRHRWFYIKSFFANQAFFYHGNILT